MQLQQHVSFCELLVLTLSLSLCVSVCFGYQCQDLVVDMVHVAEARATCCKHCAFPDDRVGFWSWSCVALQLRWLM